MIAKLILCVLIIIEIGMGIVSLKKRACVNKQMKAQVRLGEALAFCILMATPFVNWNFRWYGLGIVLLLQAIFAVIKVLKNKEKPHSFSRSKVVLGMISYSLVMSVLALPALLFPEDNSILPTGEYNFDTVSYTWEDTARPEDFTPIASDFRKITVQFWYPTTIKGSNEATENQFPLVLFSHGSFGVRDSNYSTFTELASHGYVVCSIDHTYHSFFTQQTDGKAVLCNMDFINEVLNISKQEDSIEKYEMIQGWLKLRREDMNFCLNQIMTQVALQQEEVFKRIDVEHIGAMGHSLGGACAADLGRKSDLIKAVAVIDGTMLGEETGFVDGKEQITTEAYPVPLLNFYNEASYADKEKYKDIHPNALASASQEKAFEVVIHSAGHMNFTDLPMLAPFLANFLGTGSIDAKVCMQNVNEILLEFFDSTLKGQSNQLLKFREIA